MKIINLSSKYEWCDLEINATRPKENNLCREMSEEIQRAGHFLTKQVLHFIKPWNTKRMLWIDSAIVNI